MSSVTCELNRLVAAIRVRVFLCARRAAWPAQTIRRRHCDGTQGVVDKAIAYLRTRQNPDGSFVPRLAGPGVSGVVAAALLRNGVSSPTTRCSPKTLAYLESKVQPDGGVYERRPRQLHDQRRPRRVREANTGGKYDAIIRNATKVPPRPATGKRRVPAAGRSALRRVGIRREISAGHVEHAVLARRPPGRRRAQGRPRRAAGAGVCQSLPEPEVRIQRPTVRRQGDRG